jgi:hypothetical protein
MTGVLQLPLKQNGKFSRLCDQELRNALLDDNITAAGFNILQNNTRAFADIKYPDDCIIMHLPLILPDNDELGMEFNDRVEKWQYDSITTHLPHETYYGFNQSGSDRVILHVVSR